MADSSSSPYNLPEGLKENREAWFSGSSKLTPHLASRSPRALDPEFAELVEALRLNRRYLLSFPGVTAVDVGYWVDDHRRFQNKLALRVHVVRKLHNDCFKDRPSDRLPQEVRGPGSKMYRINVIEAEYRPVADGNLLPRRNAVLQMPVSRGEANRRRRLDPLVGGISIGSPLVPVGTLGALVWDNTDGSVCILSNWHVLAGDLNVEPGNPCFQPGRFDHGRSSDVVARLKRWSLNRQTDAAIAELTGSRHYCAGEILSLFQQISDVEEPYLGMRLLKSGRSTGYSWGFIDGLYFSAAIQYSNGLVRIFEEQIHIAPLDPTRPISEPGDSGSVWVTEVPGEGYRAVGLHFAGDLPNSSFGEYALANPMSIVAKRLDFSFRPLFLEIPEECQYESAPLASQPLQIQVGPPPPVGAQPVNIVLGGLTGSGGQPVSNPIGGGGQPVSNPIGGGGQTQRSPAP